MDTNFCIGAGSAAFCLLLLLLIWLGRPLSVHLSFEDNPSDQFQYYDARRGVRVETPYADLGKSIDRETCRKAIPIRVAVRYRTRGNLFNWGRYRDLPLEVELDSEKEWLIGFDVEYPLAAPGQDGEADADRTLAEDERKLQTIPTDRHFEVYLQQTMQESDARFYARQNRSMRVVLPRGQAHSKFFLVYERTSAPPTDPPYLRLVRSHFTTYFLGAFGSTVPIGQQHRVVLGPSLGKVWVGLDPGTTGTCIAAAARSTVVWMLQEKGDGGQLEDLIIPSVLTFDLGSKPAPGYSERLFEHDGRPGAGAAGKDESFFWGQRALARMEGNAGDNDYRSFTSFKKLLGFSDAFEMLFANHTSLKVTGQRLMQLLISRIYQQFCAAAERERWFEGNGEANFLPRRAVVTVPNHFSNNKIRAMIDAVRTAAGFMEVRYITESEAVLFYYLGLPDSAFVEGSGPRTRGGDTPEQVLVFDMGGATINATLVDIHTTPHSSGSLCYRLDQRGKIGYAVGGNNIDYHLSGAVFRCFSALEQDFKAADVAAFDPHTLLPPPGQSKADREQRWQRLALQRAWQKLAVELKKKLSAAFARSAPTGIRPTESVLITSIELLSILRDTLQPTQIVQAKKFEFTVEQTNLLVAKLFTADAAGEFPIFCEPAIQQAIYQPVGQAVRDVMADVSARRAGRQNVTVLFSGRSTFFPQIKSIVLDTLASLKIGVRPHQFSPHELKTAVARGACWYGTMKSLVRFDRSRTAASFGFRQTVRSRAHYHELIPCGHRFERAAEARGGAPAAHQSVRSWPCQPPHDFPEDSNEIAFFQIMGAHPSQDFDANPQHKRVYLGSISLTHPAARIVMKAFSDDRLEALVEQTDETVVHVDMNWDDRESAQDNDLSTRWHLDG